MKQILPSLQHEGNQGHADSTKEELCEKQERNKEGEGVCRTGKVA